jgi:hypothetical protein
VVDGGPRSALQHVAHLHRRDPERVVWEEVSMEFLDILSVEQVTFRTMQVVDKDSRPYRVIEPEHHVQVGVSMLCCLVRTELT